MYRVRVWVASFGVLALATLAWNVVGPPPAHAAECGDAQTSIISCDAAKSGTTEANDSANNPIIAVLTFVMQILTGAVGVAAVGALIYAGILYSAASGEAGQVQKAKTIIKDTVIGLVCYGGMILILNFVIPGGVFGQSGTSGGGTSVTPGDGGEDDDPLTTSNKTQFSIVSMPDTQFEVNIEAKTGEAKVLNNMKWVAANKAEDKQNIQVVVGPGDLTNAGDSTDPKVKKMFAAVSKDYAVLDAANVPYSITNGNHDSDATCTDPGNSYGSRTCYSDKSKNTVMLHRATMLNRTFTTSRAGLKGLTLYKSGEIQNSYRTFRVRNTNWLVLAMEFYPRSAVFKWAQNVVATHPTYNVIVVTHGYMGSGTNVIGGGISNYCSKDGDCTKPDTIHDDLLLKYANVKALFSGHVTTWSTRTDTSKSAGHKVVQFKTTVHACTSDIPCTNPMRIVTIDLEKNTLTSKFCQKATASSVSDCDSQTIGGMAYVTSGTSTTPSGASPSATFDKITNFRDAAASSAILKPGLLYRSTNLNDATTSDKTKMSSILKGGALIDLRESTDSNYKKDPVLSGVTNVHIPTKGEASAKGYVKTFVNDATARGQFAKAIETIANTAGPALVHCKHGKDRTGWTIAMVMYIVGDGKYTNAKLDSIILTEYLKSPNVDASWLQAALSSARTNYGSVMGYVKQGLGVSDETITKLRNKMGA
jgi:protein tyrosine/serine phosphatase